MQAIILAGGFGTRLQSVVSDVPKPMAPINDKPFLEYILDELNNQEFDKVVIAVGYKKECIMDYFGNKFKNISIEYSIENQPLGTGGCVKQALSLIDDEFAFILNGDTMFKIDFARMATKNKISIACKKMFNFDRYGEVKFDSGIISSFEEKKHVDSGYINGGIYYLQKNIFNGYNLPNKFSIEKDFFEKYISSLNIFAFLSDDYFIDIGIPEDYEKAQFDFKKNKALFLDRDGIINEDYGYVHKIEDFKFTDFIFDLCKKYQDQGYMIIVVTNQAGIAKGFYSEEDSIKLNHYMVNEFKKKGIIISKTYYCPHRDEDSCNCRKPKPGMFLQAIKEYNIDPIVSIAIGDKMSDLEAANKAGIGKLYYKKTRYDEYDVDFDYVKIIGANKESVVYGKKDGKVNLKHLKLNNYSMKQTVERIDSMIQSKEQGIVVPVNLDMMRISYKNEQFRKVINNSAISVVDGKPLIWLSHNKLKYKVSGSDLIYPILDLCNEKKYSIFIVGGIGTVPEKACNNIKKKYQNVNVNGYYSPEFGFEKNSLKTMQVINEINDSNSDIVLLCLSAPKQELFFENNKDKLNKTVYVCAGATVDFLAENIKRAPKWMSKLGLEWLYRLCKEPKRLFKRYWLDFCFLIKILFK